MMNETEIKLLEILRNMRSLGKSDAERQLAVSYLVSTITALTEDTIYANLARKIVAAYNALSDPEVTTS
jgi:hypothetical protein